jgi:hypothetical protein
MIDNAPPWVVEQVREAQAFIDREWSAHVHDTEHVLKPDWRGEEYLIRNNDDDIVMVHIECRYCSRPPTFEESLIDAARAAINDAGAALIPPIIQVPEDRRQIGDAVAGRFEGYGIDHTDREEPHR